MAYNIHEHKHRFSVWTAGRAASVTGCRFSVKQAKHLLEEIELDKLSRNVNRLPKPSKVDSMHENWRNDLISAGKSIQLNLTHGVAAKLINVYLKTAYICGGNHLNDRVMALHPPIDAQLLKSLADENIGNLRRSWNKARRVRWSKLNSQEYQELIDNIRLVLKGQPMWKIENHWRGYQ